MSKGVFKQALTQGEFELEVKKSRFIVRWKAIESKAEFAPFLEHWRQQFPDARHHCWAYCIGEPENALMAGSGDDGEPSGTAGRPMLAAIVHKGFGNIAVVVIRYFGGTKLGAGGLIRAYSGSVSQALDSAPYQLVQPVQELRALGDFALEQGLRHWLSLHQGQMLEVTYAQQVEYRFSLALGKEVDLSAWLSAQGAELLS
ncbi:YigZ family protein [Agaribacterium sp. ZY112]|uniref:IMPACT family protein n=1 Tax=Agaribacterium sp. ZY112 TaxID=3233574 RepID=UPI0035239CA3